ncbi:MAG: hypothetical protein V1674_05295 [Candidatus Omnitrophota bacterium]
MFNQPDFFDRAQILENLQKRLLGLKDGYRQNIVLIGNPLMGKTSILKKFLSDICDNQIIPLYLEIGSLDFKTFILKFIGCLLYNFLKKDRNDLKEDLDFLIEESKKILPKTTAKISQIRLHLQRGRRVEVFFETLGLLESLNQESGKFSLVVFDEFHLLEELNFKDIFRELGKKIMIQKKSMYLFSSSAKYKAKKILSKELSLLFGNFEVIEVGPFNLGTSREFILDKTAGLNLYSSIIDFIINFTGGCPFYLDLICSKAKQLASVKQDDLISQVTIINVLQNLLFNSYGELNQRYSRSITHLTDEFKDGAELISILLCLANSCNKIREMSLSLPSKKKNLINKINRLLELEIIDKRGTFYQINDRVFEFWLRFVYQAKQDALDYHFDLQARSFRERIESFINDFILVSKKDTIERITELFNLFSNDSVQLERHKFKLSQFKELKQLRFDGGQIKKGIAGITKNSLWLAGIKEDKITENDVAEFAAECKKYRNKLQKKIIIAFNDIEANASLLAKQNKILTWDIENLNSLFDLYGKPRIVATSKK